MSIENIVSRSIASHDSLADINVAKLKQLRNNQMRDCFRLLDESHFRMELVAKIRDTEFINDAAARNVNATWYTLHNINGPVVWIALSGAKGTNYTMLQEIAGKKVKELICVGNDTAQMTEQFEDRIPVIDTAFTIEEAVHKAFYNQLNVQKVLFSPAIDCGTINEQIGVRFNNEVNEL
jgi:UDP-N-acetylmuramoylalanine--D-glutamate ligase